MWLLTAYCICSICCGHWADGIAANGKPALPGHTVACDSQYLNQPVYIDGVGIRVCDDTGSAITGKRIDVLFDSHDEALEFGVRHSTNVHFLKETE